MDREYPPSVGIVLITLLLAFLPAGCGEENPSHPRESEEDLIWEQVNCFPRKLISDIVFGPESALFAATGYRGETNTGAGVFRSHNGGTSWRQVNNGICHDVECLVRDRHGFLYAGTVAQIWGACRESGVYRSKNDADSWECILTGNTVDVLINSRGFIFAVQQRSVHRSTDGGDTWETVGNDTISGFVQSSAIDGENHIFVVTEEGIFRSDRSGLLWRKISNNFTTGFIPSIATSERNSIYIAVNPISGGEKEIHRSRDYGESWERIYSRPNAYIARLFCHGASDVFASIFDYDMGRYMLLRSTDSGGHWTEIEDEHVRDSSITSFAGDPWGTLFIGTSDGRILVSVSGSSSWRHVNSYSLSSLSTRDITTNGMGGIIAGVSGGMFLSEDGGETWERTDNIPALRDIDFLCRSTYGDIFAVAPDQLFRSYDLGYSWMTVEHNMPGYRFASLVFDSQNHAYTGAGSDGVYKSTDNGAHWTAANTGLPEYFIASSLAVTSTDVVFAGSTVEGLYRSADGGGSWSRIDASLTVHGINAVTVDPHDNLYVASRGKTPGGTIRHLHRSNDGGETWERIDDGTLAHDVSEMIIGAAGRIYAATLQGGLYYSLDGGDTWSRTLTDFYTSYIGDLAFHGNEILAGTARSGIMKGRVVR